MCHKMTWAVGMGLALLGVIAASIWRGGLDFTSAVAGLIGLVVPAFMALWRWVHNPERSTRASTPEQLEQAAKKLLGMVRAQWSEEIAVRSLGNEGRLEVHWGPSECGGSYISDLIDGVVSGTTADIDGLVRSLRTLPYPRLVVLGAGGSGKTVLAVLLMLRLVATYKPGDRIAVLLALSSWDPHEPLHTWMERRIAEDYSALRDSSSYGPTAVHDLIHEGKIFPIFDGLDEVPGGQFARALKQINTSFADEDGFVVTCRTREYKEASVVIAQAAVIEPQAVDILALIDFLPSSTPPAMQWHWEPVLDEIMGNPSGSVAQTLSLPLMASLASTVYADRAHNPAELLRTERFDSPEAIETHLLEEFIPSLIRLDKARDKPTRSDWNVSRTIRWLAFLAAHMADCGTPDFAWWCLYRALPIFRRRSFQRSAYLPGLGAWLAAAAMLLPFFGVRYAALTGLGYGCAVGIACMLAQPEHPLQSTDVRVRWRMWGKRLRLGALSGLGFGFWIGLRTGLSTGPFVGLRTGLVAGIVAGFIVALAAYIADIPSPPEAPTRVDFRFHGHLGSLLRTLSVGVRAGLIFGLVEGFLAALKHQHPTDPNLGTGVLVYGLISGLIFGLGSWLARWTRTPVESDDARSPAATLRADRTGAAVLSLLLSVTAGAAFGLNSDLHYNLPGVLTNGVIGFLVGLLSGAWPMYFLTSRLLWLGGRIPLPLLSFLEDCRRIGILRRVGPVYQFRHTRLHEHLVQRHRRPIASAEPVNGWRPPRVPSPRPAGSGGDNGNGRPPPGRHRRVISPAATEKRWRTRA